MRIFFVILTFMLAGQALALDPNTFRLHTGANLVELCGLSPEDPLYSNAMEFCNGYLVGAFHYYDATAPASNRFVCAPKQRPDLTAVMKSYVAWANENPQSMNERSVDSLFRFLAGAYPCKN